MILALVVVLALLLRTACGRTLRDISLMPVRGEILLVVTLVLVVALPSVAALFRLTRAFVTPVWIGVMALLLLLCALNALTNRGFGVMAAGVGLNLAVIAANGFMPVSPAAAMSLGGAAALAALQHGDLFHSAMTSSARLLLLGDVLPLPGPPALRSVLSAGDVLMFTGMLIVLVSFSSSNKQQVHGRRT